MQLMQKHVHTCIIKFMLHVHTCKVLTMQNKKHVCTCLLLKTTTPPGKNTSLEDSRLFTLVDSKHLSLFALTGPNSHTGNSQGVEMTYRHEWYTRHVLNA